MVERNSGNTKRGAIVSTPTDAYRQGLLECPPDNLVQLHQESLNFQKETKASLNSLQFQCQAVRMDVSAMRSLQWVLAFSAGGFEADFWFGPRPKNVRFYSF